MYSLNKSRNILRWAYSWYKKKGKTLPQPQLHHLEDQLENLDNALLSKNRPEADKLAHQVEEFGNTHFKKGFFNYAKELVIALVFALMIATVVRQSWFEPYEIPTGSMRPTFEEKDHLTVTKTAFGINIPLETSHFYFDPSLVQRTSVVIFTGDGMPISDVDTTYFMIFPAKKRYIKRLIAKPGDMVYFYGGKLYVVDQEGNLIKDFFDAPWMHRLEHVPYLSFEGETSSPAPNQILISQMNLPVARLTINLFGEAEGQVFNGKEWITDQPASQNKPHDQIKTYSDFWGFRNYAMARLLTQEQLPASEIENQDKGVLYLELKHTPSLAFPQPTFFRGMGGTTVMLNGFKSFIPLQQSHLEAIMDNMYTARFIVKDGRATRYSPDHIRFSKESPYFQGVPDGTYEFYYGKAYQIGWGAIRHELAADHPLYKRTPENVQRLYNLGIEQNNVFIPTPRLPNLFPHRYAYFRDGDLFLLGAPILKKDDPVLVTFNENEKKREQGATTARPYVAFRDYGPPLKDNQIDLDFMRTFALKIPEGQYLALGDNHAMSSDSRVFGFVPQANLQGAPSLILWPPGDRFGRPAQKPYPIFVLPRLIVWGIALLIALIAYGIHRYRISRPIFKRL